MKPRATAKAKAETGQETGFSLIELTVAMVITLIISGAIFGLLTTGHSAFRREPELSDRQQNIRVAMDIISKDVVNAGSNMPAFLQVFTRTDTPPAGPTLNGNGGAAAPWAGSIGATAAAARGGGDPSTNADVLEVLAAEDECPSHTVRTGAAPAPGVGGTYDTLEQPANCARAPFLALLTDNTYFWLQQVTATPPALPNGRFTLTGRVGPLGPAALPGVYPATGAFLYAARVARYKIAPNAADPADPTTPVLWRSTSGQFNTAGVAVPDPGEPGFPGANSPWQIVARGIEDLQVEYMDGNGVWSNSPTVATPCPNPFGAPPGDPANGGCTALAPAVGNPYTPVVRQVRVTLSARSSAPLLAGQTVAAGTGPNAVRGQRVSVIAPRAAMAALQMGGSLK
jgi:type II secretory pathway pseudopilin PulG